MSDKLLIDKNGDGKWVEDIPPHPLQAARELADGRDWIGINWSPKFLVIARRRLTTQAFANLHKSIDEVCEAQNKAVAFEDCDVFQLVNGRWEPLLDSSER
jgi:hypothetical protein